MRIIFMGTPDFAVPSLTALHGAGHTIVAVYTQPPRPAGRGKQLQPSPVQKTAEELGLDVRYPVTLKDAEAQAAFAALDADIAVVAAYGLILPVPVLEAPRHGCLNVHASILPHWRGAAPIQRSILAGDSATGVTIMQMEKGLDTGPMLKVVRTPVDRKTAGALTAELAGLGAQAMLDVLADLAAYPPQVQDNLEAEVIGREGAPGAVLDDQLTIACRHGAIRPTLIQRAGKPAMESSALLRGRPIPAGTVLG